MGIIFKIIGSLTALAATSLLAFESARRGAIVFGTILGLVKIAIVAAFVLLLVVILYLILTPEKPRSEPEAD
jgi:hypothetical protein